MFKRIRSIFRRVVDAIADFALAAPVAVVIIVALAFSAVWIVLVLAVQFLIMFISDAVLFPVRYVRGFIVARRAGELIPEVA